MNESHWLAILSRISPHQPVKLDDGLFDEIVPKRHAKRAYWEERQDLAAMLPSSKLWNRGDEINSFIGVRVTQPLTNCAAIAVKLASAAIERGVVPIILSRIQNCGFERFGFRVEYVPQGNESESNTCEMELGRFWNLAMIVNAADVGRLS